VSPPEVVVLDTRGIQDKEGFLDACAQCLRLPEYFGRNWDALADSIGDFADAHRPVLVVWTGASALEPDVRQVATDIFAERFVDGADILIVDDVTAPAAPDFALDHVQVAIPPGSEPVARKYWVEVVGLVEVPKPAALIDRGGIWLSGDALTLHLGVAEPFTAATKAHPGVLVSGYDALIARLEAAGYPIRPDHDIPHVRRFHTDDPFGNRIEFIAF
jgi:RNAse (barnase) inhibitor barstar